LILVLVVSLGDVTPVWVFMLMWVGLKLSPGLSSSRSRNFFVICCILGLWTGL
jgi:hypothetical protein